MNNELCKCGKVGKISRPNDERCGDGNTQFPTEILEEINLNAMAFAAGMWPGETNYDSRQREYVASVHETVAKEYAIKLHQAENKIEDKDNEIERLRRIVSKHKSGRTYQDQKSDIENMRTLLEKFISRHEAGLLPDRFIYDEIINFLDGTK